MRKLRPAVPADIPSLLSLLRQLFTLEQDFSPDSDKQRRGLHMLMESSDAYVAVAEVAGEVVGMATIQIVISTAAGGFAGQIEDVVVSESHRGQGIGSALMDHLAAWAHDKELTRLQLLADRDNHPALSFYRKQGWSMTCLRALRMPLQG